MRIAVYFVAGAIILITGSILLVRKLLKDAMEDVSDRYPEYTRILSSPMANLFGIKSGGMKQVRGNGVLLLTFHEIFFRMLLPKKELPDSSSRCNS